MRPFTVSDETVENLLNIAANHTVAQPTPLWQSLIGIKIRIRSGPFIGHIAKIKSITAANGAAPVVKLRLLGSILGRVTYLSMNLEDVA